MADGPRVGLIMGSDSDWPTMEAAAEALAEFGIRFEVGVVSAHRTPQRMLDYAKGAADRGVEVIIAGAGGAAHLPGMVASATPLPVIGVPVPLKHLDGMDSLLSIVQMPAGIPWRRCPWAAPATPGCWPSASSAPPTPRCAPAWRRSRPTWSRWCCVRTRRCGASSWRDRRAALVRVREDGGGCLHCSASIHILNNRR